MEIKKERRTWRVGRALSWMQSGPTDFVANSPAQSNEQAITNTNSRNKIRIRRPQTLLHKRDTSPSGVDTAAGTLPTNASRDLRVDVNLSSLIESSTPSMRSAAIRGATESGSERTPEHVEDARRRRPPPLFYSHPLSTILNSGIGVEHATQEADVSVSSVDLSEIVLWKVSIDLGGECA
jgi:hypothetical protein